jgi:hypothetical protein
VDGAEAGLTRRPLVSSLPSRIAGASISACTPAATSNDAATRIGGITKSAMAPRSRWVATAITTQCVRYKLYEIRPSQGSGLQASTFCAPGVVKISAMSTALAAPYTASVAMPAR